MIQVMENDAMFFFGVFGIENREKEIGDIKNVICKSCGSLTSYNLIKVYYVFHIFFIPVIKWGERYYLKSRCCNAVFEITKELGKKLERDSSVPFDNSDMSEMYSEGSSMKCGTITCRNCGRQVDSSYEYCPYCGTKMR